MTRLKNLFTCLLIIASLATLTACGGDGGDDTPDLTPEEERILALAGSTGTTWIATSITFDGAPAEGFDNFSLTIRGNATSKSYSSNNGSPIFAASGTWDFNNGNLNQLIFDNATANVFNLSNVNTTATPATLTMSVNFTSQGGAAAGTDGLYVFTMQAQ